MSLAYPQRMYQPPDSPVSRASEQSASPPLQLDPRTQALLDSFWVEETERERQFQELADQASAALVHPDLIEEAGDAVEEKEMMSVDTFCQLFQEDWQISQFWYNNRFATTLARFIRSQCADETTRVAFLCCPTAFVGFQHTNPLPETRLLEFDSRFALLDPRRFVKYDLDEPDHIPESLKGTVDICVADPPFLNESTNRKLAQTLRQLLHPTRGRLLLLTSTSVSSLFPSIYTEAPLGPLHLTPLDVGHQNNLANDFKCWSSWKVDNEAFSDAAAASL